MIKLLVSFAVVFILTGCMSQRNVEQGEFIHVADDISDQNHSLLGIPKMNPWWWIYRSPPEGWSGWAWNLRNPLHNFTTYVVGVGDRDFTRVGDAPADSFWFTDGGLGLKRNMISRFLLGCVSYRGRYIETYFGWNDGGKFGFALRRAFAADHTGQRPPGADKEMEL